VLVDRVGDLLGRRAAVLDVVLDAEVALGTARVVAGREHDAAMTGVLADHAAHGRRRQDAAAAHQHLLDAVRGGHAQDGLDRLAIEIAAVAAHHQVTALAFAQGQEDGFDKILEVAGLLELGHLLAQARGAGTLPGERGGRDGLDGHAVLLSG